MTRSDPTTALLVLCALALIPMALVAAVAIAHTRHHQEDQP